MSQDIVKLQNVTKFFNHSDGTQKVLRGINLAIPRGSIFGIIGHSGAGKSTLIRCVNGLEKPTRGQVLFDDQRIDHLSGARLRKVHSKISMIFQQFNLLPLYTIAENVALPLKYQHLSRNVIQKKVTKVLKLVGLASKAHDYPASLSGGQQQRVAIARALINDPDLILCDEATSALDPETTRSILELLKKLNREKGITLIVVTHQMNVIEHLCNEVAVLHHGKIVETGNVYSIFSNPQSPLTQNFVNTVLHLNINRQTLKAIHLPQSSQLIQIFYRKGNPNMPLISKISRRFNVNANIVLGDVEILQELPFGGLLVALSGSQQDIVDTLNYLKQINSIGLKVISYD